MHILLIHNEYARTSGEEIMFYQIRDILRSRGHTIDCFVRSSADISGLRGRVCAFMSGVYSIRSQRHIKRRLKERIPDAAYVQNVYPLISPSVLPSLRGYGVPIVMRCPNYRLMCPNGLFLSRSCPCEACSNGKEYWCLLRNCENGVVKSLGYAVRSYVARRLRLFVDNVALYYVSTEFQKRRMVSEGFPAERCEVLPNCVDPSDIHPSRQVGEYVGYVGRISEEKGISTLVDAARMCQNIPVYAAGAVSTRMQYLTESSRSVVFTGHLDRRRLFEFYHTSRCIVLPSVCYETFGLSLVEAALHGKAVIASRIGGLPEIVDDGVTGLLFEPGNAEDLAEKIQFLWDRPELCRRMGLAGREKALREYSPEKYYERLMAVYQKAIKLGPPQRSRNV